MYGPGMPLRALKHRLVSSVMTAAPLGTSLSASRHFSRDTYTGSPCSSGKSIFWLTSVMSGTSAKIFCTSSSFFLLPVTNVTRLAGASGAGRLRLSRAAAKWSGMLGSGIEIADSGVAGSMASE
jgi:hypothetical protein